MFGCGISSAHAPRYHLHVLASVNSADDAGYRRFSADQSYFKMAASLRRFVPLFDRILVQRAEAITKTKGGLLIPEKSQIKVNTAKVVAVGAGLRSESGEVIPPVVAVGDEVMIPEFGGTKVELEGKEFFLYRDSDFLAKFAPE
ncbi:unnamed protein product [Meganyctiphanes norvegica]|uniref:10 kDa heat shock protein, mitochondrial n=1 Tax=Meganyctiphanes norvegica TaxID=48144 RepID=A0AAV2PJ21_MEGNR